LVVTEKIRGRPVEYLEPSYIVIDVYLLSNFENKIYGGEK